MLPKHQRLNLSQEDKRQIFQQSRQEKTKNFRFYWRPAAEFKAAAIIPKKIVLKAAKRNLLRRQIYAAIQQLWGQELRQNLKMELVVVFAGSKEQGVKRKAGFQQIKTELISKLEKIKQQLMRYEA